MGENTNIEWCDHTFNPWMGCTKISPACDHCYAERDTARFNMVEWGPHAPRRRTSEANWSKVRQWNGKAAKEGVRHRVFVASLADVFDNHKSIADEWRADLWALIKDCPYLDFLLLTKRPQNIADYLPSDWGHGYKNVWLGTTVENQKEAARRIWQLVRVPAHLHFLSCEPLLQLIDIRQWIFDWGCGCGWGGYDPLSYCNECGWRGESAVDLEPCPECGVVLDDYLACPECDGHDGDGMSFGPNNTFIKWVICGGESGANARPMHPDWARSLRDQCRDANVPFFFKQWGEWAPGENAGDQTQTEQTAKWWNDQWFFERITVREGMELHRDDEPDLWRCGKKRAGRHLDGVLHSEFPESAA